MLRKSHPLFRTFIALNALLWLGSCESGAPLLDETDMVTLTISANPSVIKNNGPGITITTAALVATECAAAKEADPAIELLDCINDACADVLDSEGCIEAVLQCINDPDPEYCVLCNADTGVSVITINAIRADGRPVFDNTPVSLSTTGGNLIRSRVILTNGIGTSCLTSSADLELVSISAQSGTVKVAEPLKVTIIDGQPQLGPLTLVLNPTNLTVLGDKVAISLVVTDLVGNPIPNERVLLSADRGTFDSNGTFQFTTAEGVVQDMLDLTQDASLPPIVVVTVQVRDKVVSRNITVSSNLNPIPVILASSDTVEVDKPIYFEGSASSDPDGMIADYSWIFGDGIGVSGPNPSASHMYTQEGVYSVILKVTDNLGASQITQKEITVTASDPNTLPIASFRYSPLAPRTSRETFFNAQDSNDPDANGSIVFYLWDFGDGASSNQGPTTSHTYTAPGTYTVTLQVIDNEQGSSIAIQEVVLTGNNSPIAIFNTSPLNPRPGTEVTFDASQSSDLDGSIAEFHIDFGDGGQASSTIPALRHTYALAGTYEVFLTVTDNDGAFAFASGTVNVSVLSPPQAMFTVAPAVPLTGKPVLFDASTSVSPDGQILTYLWNFGDGSQGTNREVAHSYAVADTYQVQLTIFDSNNATDQTVGLVTVIDEPTPVPEPALAISKTSTGSLILDASATVDPTDPINALAFDLEAVAPAGVNVTLSETPGPVREVTVASELTAFQIIFLLTVRNSAGYQATITEPYNYINVPTAK